MELWERSADRWSGGPPFARMASAAEAGRWPEPVLRCSTHSRVPGRCPVDAVVFPRRSGGPCSSPALATPSPVCARRLFAFVFLLDEAAPHAASSQHRRAVPVLCSTAASLAAFLSTASPSASLPCSVSTARRRTYLVLVSGPAWSNYTSASLPRLASAIAHKKKRTTSPPPARCLDVRPIAALPFADRPQRSAWERLFQSPP